MRCIFVLVVVMAIGCKKADRCNEMIPKAIDLAYSKATTDPKKAEVLKAIEVRRCTEDKWSSDALDCYAKAASRADLRACRAKLVVEQAEKLEAQEAQIGGGDADVMATMSEFRDDMCACKDGDKGCGMKVQKAMADFADRNKDRLRDQKMSDDEMSRAQVLGMELAKCSTRVMGVGGLSGGQRRQDAMAKMGEFKDSMCACKEGDKDCAMKVQKEMADYAEANKDMKDQKMSDEDMKKAQDIGMELAKCSAKAMGTGR